MLKRLSMWITTNSKILKEMRIQGHLTGLLRNLYADQEATVRTGHRTMDWFPNWERSTLYAEYIMRNAALDEAQA